MSLSPMMSRGRVTTMHVRCGPSVIEKSRGSGLSYELLLHNSSLIIPLEISSGRIRHEMNIDLFWV